MPDYSCIYTGMQGLPATIDVERFANVPCFLNLGDGNLLRIQARQFEITAMQDAITNAK